MKLAIQHGRLIDPASGTDRIADILIIDGRIATIGETIDAADQHIDATGHIVCPGLIELGGHLSYRQTGTTQNLRCELLDAAAAGITTLCLTAADESELHPDIAPHRLLRPQWLASMSASGEKLPEMFSLYQAGCLGVTDAGRPFTNSRNLKQAMEYALTCELKLFFHPVEPFLAADGIIAAGETATRLGLQGTPAAAEAIAVSRILALLEVIPLADHFCRVSNMRAVHLIRQARAAGLPVTADTALPYLFFCSHDIENYKSHYLLSPPLRHDADRNALRAALADGTLAALCADHYPAANRNKNAPFPAATPGMATFHVLLPALMQFAREESIALPEALAVLTSGPATVLGIPQGIIAPGRDADLCIFDPAAPRDTATDEHDPFYGKPLPGQVTHTICAGHLTWYRDTK